MIISVCVRKDQFILTRVYIAETSVADKTQPFQVTNNTVFPFVLPCHNGSMGSYFCIRQPYACVDCKAGNRLMPGSILCKPFLSSEIGLQMLNKIKRN